MNNERDRKRKMQNLPKTCPKAGLKMMFNQHKHLLLHANLTVPRPFSKLMVPSTVAWSIRPLSMAVHRSLPIMTSPTAHVNRSLPLPSNERLHLLTRLLHSTLPRWVGGSL